MTVWSSVSRLAKESTLLNTKWLKAYKNTGVAVRNMSGHHGPRTLEIKGSQWQWHKFKDLMHFYVMIGAGWTLLIVGYCNIFIGPAQLAPIPEGYEPKHWEYYRHPITRFIARYMHPSPQQDYEKYLHLLSEVKERQWYREVTADIRKVEGLRKDVKGSYFQPVPADHTRILIDDINEQLYRDKSPAAPPQS